MAEKKYILDKAVAEMKMRRMALEIMENNDGEKDIFLAGIRGSGAVVAKNIQQMISTFSGLPSKLLTISLDKRNPKEVTLDEEHDFNDKVIIIVDDVSNSGKTLLYALKPFLLFQPRRIQTLVLVERSHNHFPVRPDYVGLSISTTLQEHIYVEVSGDTVTGAYLE